MLHCLCVSLHQSVGRAYPHIALGVGLNAAHIDKLAAQTLAIAKELERRKLVVGAEESVVGGKPVVALKVVEEGIVYTAKQYGGLLNLAKALHVDIAIEHGLLAVEQQHAIVSTRYRKIALTIEEAIREVGVLKRARCGNV